ncbi:MAG: DapH/DapD/GlmU-related protein [Erysipelotrichaceae bacterium]
MNTRQRMQQGYLYTDCCEGLEEERRKGKDLMFAYNQTLPSDETRKQALLKQMFDTIGEGAWIEAPIYYSYGTNISIGKHFYANYHLTIIDDIRVRIGDYVMFGPNVTLSVTGHPVHPDLRIHGEQFSFPITIEDHVWLGANVIVNPGVTIGKNSVIGAGSVVTKSIPANVVAVGNPCKVLRPITDEDLRYYYKDRKVEEIA